VIRIAKAAVADRYFLTLKHSYYYATNRPTIQSFSQREGQTTKNDFGD